MILRKSGVVVLLLGVLLVITSIFVSMFLLIYGIPLLVIGIIILLNKKEDKIDEIKFKKQKEVIKNK
ncbi:hypothetical protein AUJ61_01695 [Candidatus Pacearchaeota archaeon CG1_02_30_18]|nr:MAG: hypothetical protein AUJ61_01695 [Candidatus Pacearchaeota archaeon CG1_02_30_18]PIN71528.1 MAG: hypothetical protein COV77_01355 [Candidatus Pacearchaeota archaeon CG11_big_fil_rev_8_21_14_0_20_30_13]PJA71607.1 MAG: hypothetical protein CO153_00505 [Candidatus Pacearchaeota archaeon CG_4_9_14_3_um_filter_30_11]